MLSLRSWRKEKICNICGARSITISEALGACGNCYKDNPHEALHLAIKSHFLSRARFGLPGEPPKDPKGVKCKICANECSIPNGDIGFCGLVKNVNGLLRYRIQIPKEGILEWYYEMHPTNCVAWWFCPGGTGRGYPKYAVKNDVERGYANLAIFYGACNLDCLFCQNWFYRENVQKLWPRVSVSELISKINSFVTCICFFGGDPSPQILHALEVCKAVKNRIVNEKYIIRICWETNGLMNLTFLDRVIRFSLESGGIIKFDLKAWNPVLYKGLCGVDGSIVYRNFMYASKFIKERSEVPLLTASTLLIPGYIDEEEIRNIARFIASIDPEIPYSLLAFYPNYMLTDLPPTSRSHANRCIKVAKEEGLRNVHLGNSWLLGDYY
jgi:pyruvate formate lyase activating enzyme